MRFLMILMCATLLSAQSDEAIRFKDNLSVFQALEAAEPQRSVGVLKAQLDSIPYRLEDPETYARVVCSAFRIIFAKADIDRDQAHGLEQKYVLLALENPDELPADMEMFLVLRQRANVFSTRVGDRSEVLKKLDLLFHAWKRIERETDPSFDSIKKMPAGGPSSTDVMMRSKESWFPGMDPAYISDPKVRADYLAALKRESDENDRARVPFLLRSNKKHFIRHAEGFLVLAIRTGMLTEADVFSQLNMLKEDAVREHAILRVRSQAVR